MSELYNVSKISFGNKFFNLYSISVIRDMLFAIIIAWFLVVFSFFEEDTYCCRARRLSVRLSVRPSVCGNNFFSW